MRYWYGCLIAGVCTGLAPLSAWADASGRSYTIVGTHQQDCYDEQGRTGCAPVGQPLSGQDAQHPGPAPLYRDNGDGTISDLNTGLMWSKGFQRSPWNEAPERAQASRLAGYQDWRVPTIKELYSLILFDGRTGSFSGAPDQVPADAKPYLDRTAFEFEYPTGGRFIDAQYISSTAYRGITMGRDRSFFGVNFADGRIKAYPQGGGPVSRQGYYLRLVRGNPAYGQNQFRDNHNGTISDRATGLMWEQADHPEQGWAEALVTCSGLKLAGTSDWRLPNAKELQSLVDYQRSPSSTQSAALSPLFAIHEIRDEAGRRNWPFFWSSTSHLDGRQPGSYAVYIAFGEALGKPSMPGAGGGSRPPGGGDRRPLPGPGGPPPRGGPPPGHPPVDSRMEGGDSVILDVHGAGAQRSSPKASSRQAAVFEGPQGDVLRVRNAVRCVRNDSDAN